MVRRPIAPREPRPVAAIFDVDGTLCDVRLVRKYAVPAKSIPHFKKNFVQFHRESLGCSPHAPVRKLAQQLHSEGICILIVSGRKARWTALTMQRLRKWGIEYNGVYLRAYKEFRPDIRVKADIGENILREYSPVVAVDDRDDIIGVWRRLSIPTVGVREDGTLDTTTAGGSIGMHASIMNAIKRAGVA